MKIKNSNLNLILVISSLILVTMIWLILSGESRKKEAQADSEKEYQQMLQNEKERRIREAQGTPKWAKYQKLKPELEQRIRDKIESCYAMRTINRRKIKSTTFSANQFEKLMVKEGLTIIPGTGGLSYKGIVQGHTLEVRHRGSVATGDGWIQKFDVNYEF